MSASSQEIIDKRRAIVVPIDSAEQFLPQLAERVRALDDLAGQVPVSTKAAIATVKRLMAELKYEIWLHDFLVEQWTRSIDLMRSESISFFEQRPGVRRIA